MSITDQATAGNFWGQNIGYHQANLSHLQRFGPAAAQQDAEATGQSQAARRSGNGRWTERCL